MGETKDKVQLLCDQYENVAALHNRDYSIRRRHQKVEHPVTVWIAEINLTAAQVALWQIPDYKMPLVDWKTRHKIALGTARGLHYLHKRCQRRIIHRDIKSSNILLTADFEPEISDLD